MSSLRDQWDKVGERKYETGTDRGVLYPQVSGEYPLGVVWNGLTGVTESPSGAEATSIWADNMKYLTLRSVEEFGGTITAYMSPPEFDACDGTVSVADGISIGQQTRQAFGMCYRTKIGNDTDGEDYGYKLHLVYGATVSPSERAYATVNDSPEAMELSWTFDTTPVNVTGKKPTSVLTIVSTECDADVLAALEDKLYGTDSDDPYLPLPDEIIEMAGDAVSLSSLSIGSLTLSPAFSSGVTTYTASTTNASDTITAAGTSGATITIKNGTTDVTNGGSATWSTGSNTVTVKISKDSSEKTYTVTVTKS